MTTYDGYEELIQKVYSYKQEQVFAYWNDLSDKEKKLLLKDLSDIDFELIKGLYAQREESPSAKKFSPAPFIRLPQTKEEELRRFEAEEKGTGFIKAGKLAAFVVAGGQGSRLGFEGPKGMYPTGPVSGKTLFSLHGEKILKYSMKYGVSMPWLVMTSELNHQTTVDYFEKMNFFGLNPDEVYIFPQNTIPSLDRDGKLVLSGPCSLFRNPDGHGGSLTVIHSSGILERLKSKGIELISYFQVDNPLVRIADPVFIGFHLLEQAKASSKALTKAYPEEKVGVFVQFDGGQTGVVEYSDLPAEKAKAVDGTGSLLYRMGNIAVHLFNVDFIREINSEGPKLPFHTAMKKLSAFVNGRLREIDGFKFEKFVFDAIPLSGKSLVMETIREEEFAPIKNASGEDSPESCHKLMDSLHRKWLARRNIPVSSETELVEISPLTAVEPEDLPLDMELPNQRKILL